MSSFWKTIFRKLRVNFLAFTAYHPQADGQSKRINQTMEIGLRFFFSQRTPTKIGHKSFFFQSSHNNAISANTGFAFNEFIYGFKVNDTVGLLTDLPEKDFNRLRSIKKQEIETVFSKVHYDRKQKRQSLEVGDMVDIKLHHGYTFPDVSNHKLFQQRAGLFEVIKKVDHLVYELKLFFSNVHPPSDIDRAARASS